MKPFFSWINIPMVYGISKNISQGDKRERRKRNKMIKDGKMERNIVQ